MAARRRKIGINGKILRQWRGERDVKLVAGAVGIDRRQLTNLERGSCTPSFETAFRLAEYYGTCIGELFRPVWPPGERRRLKARWKDARSSSS